MWICVKCAFGSFIEVVGLRKTNKGIFDLMYKDMCKEFGREFTEEDLECDGIFYSQPYKRDDWFGSISDQPYGVDAEREIDTSLNIEWHCFNLNNKEHLKSKIWAGDFCKEYDKLYRMTEEYEAKEDDIDI